MAERWIGIRELPGSSDQPFILGMLRLDAGWPEHDEVPWCSAFLNFICWQLRVSRSKSLSARSWLRVGQVVGTYRETRIGWDVVILKRGDDSPGPNVLDAPGHVGLLSAHEGNQVWVLGGNQRNEVNVSSYPVTRILGYRRLYEDYTT